MRKKHGIVVGAGALQEMLAAIELGFRQRRRNKTDPVTLSCHDRPWSALDRADWAMRNPAR